MRIKNLNNAAFSLLEVLLASLILIVSIGGIFATLNAVRTPVANRESALTAAVFGKQVLETLRSQVNASKFYGSCSSIVAGACVDFSLYLGLHQVPPANLPAPLSWPSALQTKNTVCNPGGCLVYTVSCADGIAPGGAPPGCSNADIARRVDLNISW
jgi:Tfp pilus assembly protein PilV